MRPARRPAGRDLEPVEAAPRDADHPDAPVHHGCCSSHASTSSRVVLLLRQVLVQQDALGVAAAAQVDAHAGVAVPRQVAVTRVVGRERRFVLAVRDVLEDGRDRLRLGSLGQPEARRQAHAVAHRHPHVAHDADRLSATRGRAPCRGNTRRRRRRLHAWAQSASAAR